MLRVFSVIFAVIALVLVGAYVVAKQQTPPPPVTGYEYFWGDGCPHCAIVQEFFDSWEGKDKIQIDKKETWSNPENARLLTQRARACNIPTNEMGVPLLVKPDGECIGGDQPIIDYFKSLDLK